MTTTRILAALATAASVAVLAPASASGQAIPPNDDYAFPLVANQSGTPIGRSPDFAFDQTNTTNATTQADIGGGIPEPTTCPTGPLGKTVWYRFFPDIPGIVSVTTSGAFDSVIRVAPIDARTTVPNFAASECADRQSGFNEEFVAQVAPGAYAVQVGGFNDTGGPIETKIEFFPDTDGDGELDGSDRCPTRPGNVNGCPQRLDRSVRFPFNAPPASGGVRFRTLKVDAPRGVRISISCTQGACRRQTINAKPAATDLRAPIRRVSPGFDPRSASPRPVAQAARTTTLRQFSGRRVRNGTTITIRVTKTNAVGVQLKIRVRNNGVSGSRLCIPVGSRRAQRTCR